ncbi:MAG: hypothetical protein ACR2N5_01240 [Solirubrobacterales bacterium]
METTITKPFVLGIAVLCGILLLLPGVAPAQTLDVPATVQAAANGAFTYQAIFTAGPGGDNVLGFELQNLNNTDVEHVFADPACESPLAEGETSVLDIPIFPDDPHSLLNPAEEGSVRVSVSTSCLGGSNLNLSATTTILPSLTVPTLPEWGWVVLAVLLTSGGIVTIRRRSFKAIVR